MSGGRCGWTPRSPAVRPSFPKYPPDSDPGRGFMPVNPNATITITAFDWVPDFARGFVRDLRPRWACEEMGIDYAEHLISAIDRPADHYRDQPWGQGPVRISRRHKRSDRKSTRLNSSH